jgi:pimeloyl-ACP methyl ester carboxylesterase
MNTTGEETTSNRDVMLIHGLWMTPMCWENFDKRLKSRGFDVTAPGWPGHEGDIDQVRKEATNAVAGLGFAEIVERYETVLRGLPRQPVLIGHSFGGLVVQVLLDRGLGAAGVSIDPAPPKGVRKMTLAELKALFHVIENPANRHKVVELTFPQFRYAFANTMTEEEARVAFYRYTVPDTGRPIFQSALSDLMFDAPTFVDFKNGTRKPLLLIAGAEDHTVPAVVVRSNLQKYSNSGAVTEFREFPGRSHVIIMERGWEEIVDFALDWLSRTLPAPAHAAETPSLEDVLRGTSP